MKNKLLCFRVSPPRIEDSRARQRRRKPAGSEAEKAALRRESKDIPIGIST